MSRRVVIPALFSALACVVWSLPVGAASPANEGAAAAAVSYLAASQLPSGGWDTSDPGDFACGFSTADVALAIAETGQTGTAWSAAEADAAIDAVANSSHSAWDYLDDQAEGLCGGPPSVGKSAQLIVLAAAAGQDPAAFDPSDDGTPVDLVAILDAGIGDGSYGSIYTTPLAAFANVALGRTVPVETVGWLLAQQSSNGGFETGLGTDVDSTSLVVAALIAGGVDPQGDVITDALGFLAGLRKADGGFTSFNADDPSNPNSTAVAIIGITAAGWDAEETCWSGADPATYVSPDQYLRSTQTVDGSWPGFSPAFASAQAVQGLLRSVLPPVVAPAQTCEVGPVDPVDPSGSGDPSGTAAPAPGSDPVGGAGGEGAGGTAPTLPATGVTSAGMALAIGLVLVLIGVSAVVTSRRRLEV